MSIFAAPGEVKPPPKATSADPVSLIVRQWIRWLPASIAFFGVSFVVWTLVMILQVGRYHDALTRVEQRLKQIEKEHEKCVSPQK